LLICVYIGGATSGQQGKKMKTTETAVRAICAADPTLTPEQIDAAINALSIKPKHAAPRAYSIQETADLLGVSRRTVRAYARRGLLIPIRAGSKGERAHAYVGASVEKLLKGGAE
jgi:hypothetical protein